jgi:threonine dehydrogenase-like Zn-dependent dehydrogenase
MNKGRCPVCNSDIIIDDEAVVSDMVTCTICETDLEIITLHPINLKKIEQEGI